jgi:hypothetical protein
MTKYILNRLEIRHLRSLCGLTGLSLYTTSMSITWGRNALAPSISISNRRNSWIIIRGELGYSPKLEFEYGYEFNFVSVSKEKAPESVQYIKHEHGFQMMDRNLSSIDFERPYELDNISIVHFTDDIQEDESISYDGALIFSFADDRRFSLASYSSPGGLIEFSTETDRIDWLQDQGVVSTLPIKF